MDSQNWFWRQLDTHSEREKKIKLDPFLKPYTRISSKFTRDLNIKNIKGHGTDDNNLGVGETLKI